jgi:S-formylglutathione hydrolase FrmB/lysophospholipase L1-like esterase
MRRLAIFTITLLFSAHIAAQLDHPNLSKGSLQSEALGREVSYYIYTPSTNEPDERFPVVYLLHGKTQTHEAWLKWGKAATFADNYRCILVFVGEAKYSWYLDSTLVPESQFFTYITEDLIEHIDTMYPTMARKEGRAIMGLSMGGHGAFLAAARRPDLYMSASSMSGVLKLSDHPDRKSIVERLGPMEEFPTRWRENSVYEHAEAFRDAGVALLFDCGKQDSARGILNDNHLLHARLLELNIPHIWRELPGDHNWRYWRARLPEHLNFHAAQFSDVQKQKRWTQHYFVRLKKFLDENMQSELTGFPAEVARVSMFGSSGIEGMKPQLLPAALPSGKKVAFINRGISSDRLGIDERGLSKRMESSVFDLDPHVVVIANGTNDIGELHRSKDGHPSIDRMIEEYNKIVDTIQQRSPDIKILIVACAPVRGRFSHLSDSLVEYNTRIKNIAESKGYTYVDTYSLVVGDDGLVREEYSTDGLHFTDEAKQMWIDMVVSAIDEAVAGVEL